MTITVRACLHPGCDGSCGTEQAALADAARRFVTAELEMSGDFRPDMGTVTACLAAHHDMYVLAGLPCGCDEGTCPGSIG